MHNKKQNTSQTILITGGAGFIGSALAAKLQGQGHTMIVLDNFNEAYDVQLKKDRVDFFLDGIEVIEGDIRDQKLLVEIFSSKKIDAVCHLAALAGVRTSVQIPNQYIDVNLQGTTTLLETMVECGCSQIVFASSSSVYGNSSTAPFTEEEVADRPESVYGATKRAGELLLHSYCAIHNIEATCLRFFTVYGPWSRPDMAMLTFAHKIAAGEPIDVYNHGNLKRDFTYIDDIVTGFVAALKNLEGFSVYNLGRGEVVELMRYINVLEEKLGKKAQKNLLPMQPGDVYETYADTQKAQAKLGFAAETSIEEGIAQFVAWYLAYYQAKPQL